MPITLITGPANAGKAELVMDAVRAQLARDAAPILVVPTRADVDHYRRELAGDGALMGAEVQRFAELIALAVRCARESDAARSGTLAQPVLSAASRERLLAAIAARQVPALAALAGSPGFARALARLVGELQELHVAPARLRRALLEAVGADAPAAALADLYERYQLTLRRIGRVAEEQLALHALDALRHQPALWGGRPVLFYGYDDLTRLQLDAIETLGRAVGADVTVALSYEPDRVAFAGRAGTFEALAPLCSRHVALDARDEHYAPSARATLSHLERSLFEPQATRVPAGDAVLLIEGADERHELELIAAHISTLLKQGMQPGEIAVVAQASAAAAELLEEVFAAAGVPFSLQRRRRFGDSAIGAALLGLLRCTPRASGANARGAIDGEQATGETGTRAVGRRAAAGRAQDLLAWLRAPGLLDHPQLADRLEASLRRSGADSADQARALWEQRHWPIGAIDGLVRAQERGPAALAARAERELARLFAAAGRRQARVLDAGELDEAAALAVGRRALSEMRELARLAPQLAARDAFSLARSLEGLELVSGARPSPAAVSVLHPLALRARRVRALFVCRLQEGIFPSTATAPALLSEDERQRVAQASGLRLGGIEDALARERYLLYAAVSRPQELLVLSWHSAREDGEAAMRSLFVDDVCDLLGQGRGDPAPAVALARPPQLLCPAPDQAAPSRSGSHAHNGSHPRNGESAPVASGVMPLRDPELLADLRAHTWSPSSLAVWLCCPVRWLVERLLRADQLDPDAEPLARGGLAHLVLGETFEELRRRTGSARLTPASLGLARELLGDSLQRNAPQVSLSAAPERRPGALRRLHADLERYLEHAASSTQADERDSALALEPAHLELEFGFGADGQQPADAGIAPTAPLPAFDLGGGVMLRGRVDRVDVNGRGEAVVYDYKGATVSPSAKWLERGDVQIALYMRAVQALVGVRVVGGFYQPLSGSDLRARGLLEQDAAVQLECVGDDAREPAEASALLDELVATARAAAAQASAGELRPRPQTCSANGSCAYPAICRCGS